MLSSDGPEVNKEQMEEQCNIFLVMYRVLNINKQFKQFKRTVTFHNLRNVNSRWLQ